MDRCLEDQNKQAWRLLNNTGISSIPVSALDGVDGDIYKELLQNASVLYNETLITCNKTEFLTVRILGKKQEKKLKTESARTSSIYWTKLYTKIIYTFFASFFVTASNILSKEIFF